MKSTLKLIVIIAAGLIICYVALIDNLLKQLLEQQGSQLLKAKLEVKELKSSLFPPTLIIYNLAATNPEEPMRNLISADEIRIKPKIKSLFKKNILIDSVTITNLRFQQRRAISGAIESLTPELKTQTTSTQLSTSQAKINTNTANTAAIIEKITAPLLEDINSLNAQALDIKTQWQQRRDKLIDSNASKTYRARWAALNKATPIDKLNGFRQLENAIKADIDTINTSQNDLNLDLLVVQELQQQAENFIAQRVDAGINTMTQTHTPSLTESLLAGKMKAIVSKLFDQKNLAIATWPIYIKSLQLNGFIELGNEPLAIEATAERIYYSFENIKHPTTFKLNTPTSSQGQLVFSGIIDQRDPQKFNTRAQLQLSNAPVATLSLSDSDEFRVMLGRATMSVNSTLELQANQLQLSIDSQFRDAQLTIETNLSGSSNAQEANSALTTTLADMLRGIDRLDITLLATGDFNHPQFSVSSSIDPLLQTSTNQLINAQLSNLRPQLSQDINQNLMASLGELKTTREALEKISTELSAQQQVLHNLLTPFH